MFGRRLTWLVPVLIFLLSNSVFAAKKLRGVTVNADRIVLGDVVRNAPRNIADLDLGPAPKPGKNKFISGKQVRTRLKQAMVKSRGLRIPGKVRVHRASQNVNELTLRKHVERALARQLPEGLGYEDLVMRGGMVMPRGKLRVELEMPRKVHQGLYNFKASVYAGKSKGKTTLVRVNLRRDAALEREVIERGDTIWIKVRSGGVVVSTRGIAQQDGRTGQRIAVMPRQGRKMIYGMVTDAGVVEMDL
jgi:flagella basal body P-ring formation protein FlgA